ncbi:MAG: hypothetical protein Q9217_006255 [Psora testacea]
MAPQIILTTGANKGLGLATIQVISKRVPSTVHILGCRDISSGKDAIQKLRDQGIMSEIEVLQLDVTNDDHITAAVQHVETKYGRLDVLINNAGIVLRPRDSSLSALRYTYTEMCATNLTSVAIVTTAFMPLLHASQSPRVVNITSGLGSIQNTLTKKMVRFAPYGSSKIGMNGLSVHMQAMENDRVEAEEKSDSKGGSRVRFIVVTPGVLKTALTKFVARGKEPSEGAEVVVRLAMDVDGSYEGGTHWEFEEGEIRAVPW